jgi:hypothetical protein
VRIDLKIDSDPEGEHNKHRFLLYLVFWVAVILAELGAIGSVIVFILSGGTIHG